MHTLTLKGCAPVPLAHYLKALGILRLVGESEQGDVTASCFWENNQLVLKSQFDREKLVEFFFCDYRPTPIMVPWSGEHFFAVNQKQPASSFDEVPTKARAIEAILSNTAPRLLAYVSALRDTYGAMDRAGVKKKKDIEGSGGPQRRLKAEMLKSLRGSLPDGALAWMDAAAIIEPDAVAFNVLLGGGGGSDGNSHFSDNFMQSLWMALPEFDVQRRKPVKAVGKDAVFDSRAALNESLFGTQGEGTKIPELSPVLFDAVRRGGPNQTTGFEAKAASNPWDFILMLEGSVLFAGAIGRKLDDHREPSARFPFLFQASPVGLGSSYLGESSGRELWLPLWSKPAALAEIRALLAEGRVEKHGRMAKRGTDAFVAAAQLGFDRGITGFQRIGFFKGRIGGDNYFTAIDQGRITPRRNHSVDLLREADEWLTRLNNTATSDKCPASVASAVVALERRIADLAVAPQEDSTNRLLAVLAALGATERALAKSFKWAKEAYIPPLSGLSAGWVAVDVSREDEGVAAAFHLAASLAGVRASFGKGKETLRFRQHLEPLTMGANEKESWVKWDKQPSNDVAWHEGDLTDSLNAMLARRLVRVEKSGARGWPDFSHFTASLRDITAFIEGDINEPLLADLIWGLSLVDWEEILRQRRREKQARADATANAAPEEQNDAVEAAAEDASQIQMATTDDEQSAIPSSFYALLRLCFRAAKQDETIPLDARILHRAINGDGSTAAELAARRLRASGRAPLVQTLPVRGDIARRTAAAMLFPIGYRDFHLLERMILKPTNQ